MLLVVDAMLAWAELMWAENDTSALRVMMYLPGAGFLALETVRREAIEGKCLGYYRGLP